MLIVIPTLVLVNGKSEILCTVAKYCINSCSIFIFVEKDLKPFPQQYATALFSFLYHLASYENGKFLSHLCHQVRFSFRILYLNPTQSENWPDIK